MLWDIIRDFIVAHITGGTASNGNVYDANIGWAGTPTNDLNTFNDVYYLVGKDYDGAGVFMTASDWLATTLTIISMCLIVAFAIWLVRWIFKAVSSAFLLK